MKLTTDQIRARHPLRMSHSTANVVHELCDRLDTAEASHLLLSESMGRLTEMIDRAEKAEARAKELEEELAARDTDRRMQLDPSVTTRDVVMFEAGVEDERARRASASVGTEQTSGGALGPERTQPDSDTTPARGPEEAGSNAPQVAGSTPAGSSGSRERGESSEGVGLRTSEPRVTPEEWAQLEELKRTTEEAGTELEAVRKRFDLPRADKALPASDWGVVLLGNKYVAAGPNRATVEEAKRDLPHPTRGGLQRAWVIAHEVAEASADQERKLGALSVAGKIHDALALVGNTTPDVEEADGPVLFDDEIDTILIDHGLTGTPEQVAAIRASFTYGASWPRSETPEPSILPRVRELVRALYGEHAWENSGRRGVSLVRCEDGRGAEDEAVELWALLGLASPPTGSEGT